MKEIFKTIPGFKDYEASTLGRIKSSKRYVKYFDPKSQKFIDHLISEKILKPLISDGYKKVSLHKNTIIMHSRKVSVLILETFISSCPEGMECSHLNGNRLDDRLSNLVWETRTENQRRRIEHGTDSRGENHGRAKLTEKDVIEIKKMIKQNLTNLEISKKFNVCRTAISLIRRNINWKHIQLKEGV